MEMEQKAERRDSRRRLLMRNTETRSSGEMGAEKRV